MSATATLPTATSPTITDIHHAVYGPEGVRFYTRLKTVTSRWPTGIRTGVDTTMPTLG